jgi:lipopolysaccharide export system permease protein
MKLVDRLIWRELLGPVVNSFFMFLVLLFTTAYLFKMTDWLVKGASMLLVAEAALYSLPVLVTQCFPMAMLLGCLLAFGRLSGDSEHVALFASGVSFYRIARPVAWMGLLLSILGFVWNETVVPPAQSRFYRLQRSALENIEATDHPIFYTVQREGGEGADEWVYIAGGYDAKQQVLRQVTILKMSDDPKHAGQPDIVVYAKRVKPGADPKGRDWQFFECYVRYLRPEKEGDRNSKLQADAYFDTIEPQALKVRGGQSFKGVMEQGEQDNRRMTFRELRDKINNEHKNGDFNTGADEFNLWEKVSLPLASLIFGLVGAPLGVRPHRGSRTMGFGIAMVIIFFYWVTHNWMFQLGKGGTLPPLVAAFAANIAGIFAAVFLMARTRQ